MNRLVVVDDHDVVRHGLKAALEGCGFSVTASVGSVADARSAIAALAPDAIIVDINLPDGTGYDLIRWIRAIDRQLPILVLTLNDSPEHLHAARKCGANAFLIKSASIDEIVAALNLAVKSPGSFSSTLNPTTSELKLSAREFDVLALIEKGLSNDQIAQKLHISLSTVKSHVSSILQKLSVENRIAAIRAARESGLLTQ